MTRAKCHGCGARAACVLVSREIGGSYNRAARWLSVNCCERCAREAYARYTPGQGTLIVDRWSTSSLRRAVARFDATPDEETP